MRHRHCMPLLALLAGVLPADCTIVPKVGVFWPTPEAVQSSSACASVIYFQGSQDVGTNLTRMPGGQLFDHSRPIVYAPSLKGCVQCAQDRYFSPPMMETAFFAPAHCRRCPAGEKQDETGMGSVPARRKLTMACNPPLVEDSYGECTCPEYTKRIPHTDYCECVDPVAHTEYDAHTYQVSCVCPTGTDFVLGQCLCPLQDQIFDPLLGRCTSCPANHVVSGGLCSCIASKGSAGIKDLRVCEKRWFQSKAELKHYIADQTDVEVAHVAIDDIRGSCEKTFVDITVPDACGKSGNVTLPIHFDPSCPQVSISSSVQSLDMRHPGLHDIGFSFHASDDCGLLHEATTLTIYSNQMHMSAASPQVRVHPIYDSAGGLVNFQVFLRARVFTKCNPAMGKLCRDANPRRVYILRLCVTNNAGCISCDEAEVVVTKSTFSGMKKHYSLSRIVVPKVTSLSGSTASSVLGTPSSHVQEGADDGLKKQYDTSSPVAGDSISTGSRNNVHQYSYSDGNYILGTYTPTTSYVK